MSQGTQAMARAGNESNDPRVSARPSQGNEATSVARQSARIDPHRRPNQKTQTRVSWYGTLLIVSTLLLAAGWELLRWIVLVVTLD